MFPRHSEFRNTDFLSILHGREMGTDPGCRDIGAEHFINPWLSALCNTADEFVHKMRVRSVMSAARALFQGFLRILRIKVFRIDRILLNGFRQCLMVVRQIHRMDPGKSSATSIEQQIAWKRSLTPRMILAHQGGFPAGPAYYISDLNMVTNKRGTPGSNQLYAADREAALKAIFGTPLDYAPGSKTVYSDVDYMLLGFIVEKLTGSFRLMLLFLI